MNTEIKDEALLASELAIQIVEAPTTAIVDDLTVEDFTTRGIKVDWWEMRSDDLI